MDYANKYYDNQKPWIQNKEDIEGFKKTIYTCTVFIANIANLIEPFMPNTTNTIKKYLQIEDNKWEYINIDKDIKLDNIQPLFNKM